MVFDFSGRLRPVPPNRGAGTPPTSGGLSRFGRGGGNGRPSWLPWVIIGAIVLFAFVLVSATAGFWANLWWFDSLGLQGVLITRYTALIVSLLVGFLIALAFLAINFALAIRAEGNRPITVGGVALGRRLTSIALAVAAVLLAGFFALASGAEWEAFLRFLHRVPFGVQDPQFGLDNSFYVFVVPVIDFCRGWLATLIVFTAIGVAVIHATKMADELAAGRFRLPPATRAHLSVLGALYLGLTAFGYWMDTRELVFSTRGVVYGASYTDVNAQLPADYILLVIAAIAAVVLLVNAFARQLPLFIGALGVWIVAAVLIGGAYPATVQSVTVKPNEFDKETPYLTRNIAATRDAYNITGTEVTQFPAVGDPTRADITANTASVQNARLWDYRPLLPTFGQLQQIRQYYSFLDVDVERYQINGQYRQVMVSARELDPSKLASQSQTWQNQHLIYTHGYGAVVSSANEVVGEGTPSFLLAGIPPVGPSSLKIDESRIYYGELTGAADTYAIVKTRIPEFDRPSSDNAETQLLTTTYTGRGVPIGDALHKLLLSTYLGESKILLSSDITGGSEILYRRNIMERIRTVAPFLAYDSDPYLAIADGRLVWIIDAYTTTDRYPYSQPFAGTSKITGAGPFNYLRNSVKVTVDAYDGGVKLFVSDPTDPIIRTYQSIYPELFVGSSEASPGVKAQFRYPEGLMDVQTNIYTRYHVTGVKEFYQSDDQWAIAREQVGTDKTKVAAIESYYVLLRLPGQQKEEFALVRPFTPGGGSGNSNRQNMVAILAGRSDGENYGKLVSYVFPSQSTVQGPLQVQARINQEPDISQQITLLDQSGSQVNFGNFLILPLGNTILYIEPLYVQATNSPFPQLKRVIVASQSRVIMRASLDEALTALLGNEQTVTGPITAPNANGTTMAIPPPTLMNGDTRAIAADALAAYQRGQDALKRNDFAAYGMEQARVEADLRQLNGTAATTAPMAAPVASPGAANTTRPAATGTARP